MNQIVSKNFFISNLYCQFLNRQNACWAIITEIQLSESPCILSETESIENIIAFDSVKRSIGNVPKILIEDFLMQFSILPIVEFNVMR